MFATVREKQTNMSGVCAGTVKVSQQKIIIRGIVTDAVAFMHCRSGCFAMEKDSTEEYKRLQSRRQSHK